MLELVDCDQRFKFPTPSLNPLGPSFDLDLRVRCRWDVRTPEALSGTFAGPTTPSWGFGVLSGAVEGLGPGEGGGIGAARLIVTTEDVDSDSDPEEWPWRK